MKLEYWNFIGNQCKQWVHNPIEIDGGTYRIGDLEFCFPRGSEGKAIEENRQFFGCISYDPSFERHWYMSGCINIHMCSNDRIEWVSESVPRECCFCLFIFYLLFIQDVEQVSFFCFVFSNSGLKRHYSLEGIRIASLFRRFEWMSLDGYFCFFHWFHEMRDALSNQDSYPTVSWKIAYSALNQLKSLVWAVPSRWRVMENRQFPSHLSGFTGAVSFWRNSISFGIGRKFWSLLCRLTLATGFELSNTE